MQPEDHAVLMSQSPVSYAMKYNMEKTAQIMFETFNIPAFYLSDMLELCLAACGLTSGLSVNVETGVTHLGAIYEGAQLQYHFHRFKVGATDITWYYYEKLELEKYGLGHQNALKIARDIKEQLSYVSTNYKEELEQNYDDKTKEYTLPDGRVIKVGKERFIGPEIMFDPFIIDLEFYGLPHFIASAIRRLPTDIQDEMAGNIILSGGGSLYPGFLDRVEKEVAASLTEHSVKVTSAPGGTLSAWLGGKAIAELQCFPTMCMTKEEYDEHGPSLIWKKCY